MNHNTLNGFREVIPFVPFVIRMADGRSFRVPHRDVISVSPTSRTVVVHNQSGGLNVLNSLLITDIELDAVNEPSASQFDENA